jgi:hypothetical protein
MRMPLKNLIERLRHPERVRLQPLLRKIDTDLRDDEMAGVLFGGSLYQYHTSQQPRTKDVDVLLMGERPAS